MCELCAAVSLIPDSHLPASAWYALSILAADVQTHMHAYAQQNKL